MSLSKDFSRTLLRASWWAVLLGLVLKGLQLAVLAATNGGSPAHAMSRASA